MPNSDHRLTTDAQFHPCDSSVDWLVGWLVVCQQTPLGDVSNNGGDRCKLCMYVCVCVCVLKSSGIPVFWCIKNGLEFSRNTSNEKWHNPVET